MSLRKILLPFISVVIMLSCTTKKEVLVEPVKDLNALWRLQTVTRNETDITQFIDSAGFRLNLSPDNTYTLQGDNIPFVVNVAAGTWSVDDPQYPYSITFKPTDSTNTFTGSIATPAIQGNRTLSIKFSPGCHSNAYVYTFEKVY
ncbi:MAG: DUF5004 domain-containing protein [Parafilimonas sp.]